MAQIVILSDVVSYGELGAGRYIGPYVIASQLEDHGFSTVVLDFFTAKANFFEYLENFIESSTLIVGISSTFLSPSAYFKTGRGRHNSFDSYNSGFLWKDTDQEWLEWSAELKELLRRKAPKAKIVIGGVKAAKFLKRPDLARDVDYFALGAGDSSIVQAASALRDGKEPEIKEIAGLKVFSQMVLKHQMNACPVTTFQKKWAIQQGEALPIEISRGCIFNCKYCYYERKSSLRKSVDILIQEITRNYELFGTNSYSFTDDCFNDSREKVETICGALLKLPFKIDFTTYARVDVGVKFPHTADLMVEAGASSLHWGLESFHPEAARRAGKGTPPEKVKEFLLWFKKQHGHRCFSFGSFITGLPYEPESSVHETIDWLLAHDPLHAVGFGPLTIAPYTESLDQTVVDFADYSRHPEKYGFSRIGGIDDWEHEWMTYKKAAELANFANQQWLSKKESGVFSFTWQYYHLRSLGYTNEDLLGRFQKTELKASLTAEVIGRHKAFIEQYWADLARLNPRDGQVNADHFANHDRISR